jgi:hypothetical protein
MSQRICIDLRELTQASRLSPAVLASLAESASVMLDVYHRAPPPPTPGKLVRRGHTTPVDIVWEKPTDQQRETHANEKDAAEDGGAAIAIAVVRALGYVVVRRTRQGSGCDYLMVREGEPENDFHKLEVSGTGTGNLASRLREKVAQGKGGDLDRPGAAVVVGFKAAKILVEEWT